MAPTRAGAKVGYGQYGVENALPVINTRSRNGMAALKSSLKQAVKSVGKRKAGSPLKELTVKRAAFGDLTNALVNGKKVTVVEKRLPTVKAVKKKETKNQTVAEKAPPPRLSDQFSEESLYVSASEDTISKSDSTIKSEKEASLSRDINLLAITDKETPSVPPGVVDFDKENWNDPFQVSHYAMDIFRYLKSREETFAIDNYLPRQKSITAWMRALLVDWMVEVQESFELNHETLYLGVKLVDLFLCKETTKKDELQLLGAASLFVASKFDERIPPSLDDFLYICDGAYTLKQLLDMEINVLKVIGFDLGIPLSYRFLRRYARCTRVSMPTLTLARYILEHCLMEYALVSFSDSKMAAAALYLAIRMKNLGQWTPTHEYYSGYKLEDIMPIAQIQNICLHKKPKDALSTVRNKYSHKIFFEVATVPLIPLCDLH